MGAGYPATSCRRHSTPGREKDNMAEPNERRSETSTEIKGGPPAPSADSPTRPQQPATSPTSQSPDTSSHPPATPTPARRGRKWLWMTLLGIGLAVGVYFLYPVVDTMLKTVST